MTTTLVIQRALIRDFRNLEVVNFDPAPRVNVLAGDNGQGKTSVLEALYFVTTSRSFRTERLPEVIRDGTKLASVHIQVLDDGYLREQRATLRGAERSLLLDGQKPSSLGGYATRSPVVVFHPGDLALVTGSATARRTLLDRLALFANPTSLAHRSRYRQAIRERQAVLEQRGVNAVDLGAYETLIAEYGALITRVRSQTVEEFSTALRQAFAKIAAPGLELVALYAPGGSADPTKFAEELAQRRNADLRRRTATYGPHRDDIRFVIDGRSARHHASQGQQRVLALAIKLAELECVGRVRDAYPVLLLDDISSELDPQRAGAVYDHLRESPGQVFVSTTRPDLFQTPGISQDERADFRLEAGVLRRVG